MPQVTVHQAEPVIVRPGLGHRRLGCAEQIRRTLVAAHAGEVVDLDRPLLRTGSAGVGVSLTELIRAAAAPSARSRTGSGSGGIALVPGTHAASRSPYPVRTARS